ncbi:MAG TPA: hypothetical protein VLM87_12885, partial [Rubrivivax sp.]|nr:hypothetical protein [Rubrivivax sp.]
MERKLRITVDGRVYDVTVEDLSDSGSLIYPARSSMTSPAPPTVESAPPGPAPVPAPASAGPGDVVATLGGVVESVVVAVGQKVRLGETVVVLEAM